jgi:hypothetical protein
MDIDLTKWEKSRFQEIKSGDHILALRHSSIDVDTPGYIEGIVGVDKDHDWLIAGWKVTPTGIHDLLVYKKRPEFVMPTKLGAIVKGEDSRGKEITFVFADADETDLPWYGSDSEWYSVDEILEHNYLKVIAEGVAL